MRFKTLKEAEAFMQREYGHLVGCTITKVEAADMGNGFALQLTVALESGQYSALTVLQDPEGNGPGFLSEDEV